MKNQEKFTKIVEWLYVNDGMFKNKNEWREKFIGMLRRMFCEEEQYSLGVGGQLGATLCTCHNSTAAYCPIHNLSKPL